METVTQVVEHPGQSSRRRRSRLPGTFWAAGILGVVNVAVGLCVAFSPALDVTMYGANHNSFVSEPRPSAFDERVETKVATLRPLTKLTPVIVIDPAIELELDLPRSSQVVGNVGYVSGADAVKLIESQHNFPRSSMRRATESPAAKGISQPLSND